MVQAAAPEEGLLEAPDEAVSPVVGTAVGRVGTLGAVRGSGGLVFWLEQEVATLAVISRAVSSPAGPALTARHAVLAGVTWKRIAPGAGSWGG